MPDKQKYAYWIADQPKVPIFLQPWWLDAVCVGKHWEAKIWEEKGEVIAAMPYLLRHRMGMRFVVMPQMTQLAGAWLASNANPETIADAIDSHLKSLHLSYYYQQFPINSPIPALLANRGYAVSPRVTYRIEDCSDVEKVVEKYHRNKRQQLKKASTFSVKRGVLSVSEFYAFHTFTLAQEGKVISYSRQLLIDMFADIAKRDRGVVVSIYNGEVLIAASVMVWDDDAVRYLITSRHHDYANSGVMALMVTEGVKIASERGVAFDFEGSMIPGVAQYFSEFGSVPITYYSVERYFNPFFRFFTSAYQYLTRRKR